MTPTGWGCARRRTGGRGPRCCRRGCARPGGGAAGPGSSTSAAGPARTCGTWPRGCPRGSGGPWWITIRGTWTGCGASSRLRRSRRWPRCPGTWAADGLAVVAGQNLVTASALLDLVSESWLAGLVRRCADNACGAYFALTYDGEVQWMTESAAGWRIDDDPDDGLVRDAVNRHQRSDKGFGPALGPRCRPPRRAFVPRGRVRHLARGERLAARGRRPRAGGPACRGMGGGGGRAPAGDGGPGRGVGVAPPRRRVGRVVPGDGRALRFAGAAEGGRMSGSGVPAAALPRRDPGRLALGLRAAVSLGLLAGLAVWLDAGAGGVAARVDAAVLGAGGARGLRRAGGGARLALELHRAPAGASTSRGRSPGASTTCPSSSIRSCPAASLGDVARAWRQVRSQIRVQAPGGAGGAGGGVRTPVGPGGDDHGRPASPCSFCRSPWRPDPGR